ncbi:MAG: TetR/AcrR family transcriptional regulator [Verrucomicrobia bacterium]|nr:TetR/AcrR family transcriptional regulator [Verrucomicrobiota bacterium]
MTRKRKSKPVTRKPRVDAQRNRERLLEAARAEFRRSGANASLEEIGNQAGVGPGTLYRHFPTRDSLIEAVFRDEVEKLSASAERFAETLPPIEALRAWMLLFTEHIASKRIVAPVLKTYSGGPERLYEGARGHLLGAMEHLVRRAVQSQELRKEINPFDLLRALIGLAHETSGPDWNESARRIVNILIAGSRTAK